MLSFRMKPKTRNMFRTTQVTFLTRLLPIWPLVCEKQIEMFKVYRPQTKTTDAKRWQYLAWSLGSGELKSVIFWKIDSCDTELRLLGLEYNSKKNAVYYSFFLNLSKTFLDSKDFLCNFFSFSLRSIISLIVSLLCSSCTPLFLCSFFPVLLLPFILYLGSYSIFFGLINWN